MCTGNYGIDAYLLHICVHFTVKFHCRHSWLSMILDLLRRYAPFGLLSVQFINSQFLIRFWPDIDSALRDAACARGVEVNLLVSCWSHSPGAMFIFLQSLSVLSKSPLNCNIHVVCSMVLCGKLSFYDVLVNIVVFSRKCLRYLTHQNNLRFLLHVSTMRSIW